MILIASNFVAGILNALYVFLVIFSNLNIIFLFLRKCSIRVSPRNWLLMNMMMSDLFGGWLYPVTIGSMVMSDNVCIEFVHLLVFVTFNVNTFTLLGITVYQGLQIINPLQFPQLQNKRTTQVYIVLSWIASLVIALPMTVKLILPTSSTVEVSINGTNITTPHGCITHTDPTMQYMVIVTTLILLPAIFVMLSMQVIIYKIVRRHLSSMKKVADMFSTGAEATQSESTTVHRLSTGNSLQPPYEPTQSGVEQLNPLQIIDKFRNGESSLNRMTNNIKAAKVLAIVMMLAFFGWLPLSVFMIVLTLCVGCLNPATRTALIAFIFIAALTSVINPWVYAFRLPEFKAEIDKLKASTRCWFVCFCCSCVPCLKKKKVDPHE